MILLFSIKLLVQLYKNCLKIVTVRTQFDLLARVRILILSRLRRNYLGIEIQLKT